MTYLIGIIFTLYGLYSLWAGVSLNNLFYIAFGVFPLIGDIGLSLKKQWSKFIIYLVSIGISTTLIYTVYYQYKIGAAHYESFLKTFISLLPAGCIILFCIGSSIAVHQKMRTLKIKQGEIYNGAKKDLH